MSMFEQLKLMHENRLYSNVSSLASLLLTVAKNKPDELNLPSKYQTYVYYGDSLLMLKEYRKAEVIFKKALQMIRSFGTGNMHPFSQAFDGVTSEVEVKYKMHLCLVNLKQPSQAINLLESITAKQRTPCINMALAKLYHESGASKSAIASYKDVLRECPFATEAAQALLCLGIKGPQVMSMMVAGPLMAENVDWLSMWINGHAFVNSGEFNKGAASFRQVDIMTPLRDNADVLVSLAKAHFISGDFRNAMYIYERAHSLDPYLVKGADNYAVVLAIERKAEELESLASRMLNINERVPEPWIVLAYTTYTNQKKAKAAKFVNKALSLSPNNLEALILNGLLLMELRKPEQAMASFGEASKIAPHRYEAHKGLIDSLLAQLRINEAIGVAESACKHLNNSARGLTLFATTLNKDPSSKDKVKIVLEKALEQDPYYLDAAHMLATIYEQEGIFDIGIKALLKVAESMSAYRLHQKLGELLTKAHQHEKALVHFNIALKMNSAYKKPERQLRSDLSNDSSFDVEDIADDDTQVLNLLKLI